MTSCVANWPLILEYLKVLLAWPTVVLSMGLWCIHVFRGEIARLIDRLRKAAGVEFDGPPPSAQQSVPVQVVDEADHLGRISSNPELARAEILKWWRATMDERIFVRIYGSQIRMLELLAAKEPVGELEANLLPFYTEHVQKAESRASTWPQYLGFLQSSDLMRLEERNGQGFMRITSLGTEFLSYIHREYRLDIPQKLF